MPQEVQTRALIENDAAVEAALLAYGFIPSSVGEQVDIILDRPDAAIFNGGGKFRIRSEGGSAQISYKTPSQGDFSFGRRNHIRIDVQEQTIQDFITIFGALGIAPIFHFRKKRRSYTCPGLLASIDSWPIIGHLLELEGNEDAVRSLVSEAFPELDFGHHRLKELFASAAARRGLTLAQAQADYEREHGVQIGRLDLLQ